MKIHNRPDNEMKWLVRCWTDWDSGYYTVRWQWTGDLIWVEIGIFSGKGSFRIAKCFLKTWNNVVKESTEVVPGGAVQLPGLLLQLLHVPPQHVQPEHHCMGSENEKIRGKRQKKYSLHFLTDYLRFSQTKHLPHPSTKSLLFPIKTDFNREEYLQIIF